MTVLASTPEYLVEVESGLFTIARRTDGHALACKNKGESGLKTMNQAFRECLGMPGSPEAVAHRSTVTFIRILKGRGIQWRPLYNPKEMP